MPDQTRTRPTLTKTSVDYRVARRTDRNCDHCAMYHNGRCDLVIGPIGKRMTCDRWTREKG